MTDNRIEHGEGELRRLLGDEYEKALLRLRGHLDSVRELGFQYPWKDAEALIFDEKMPLYIVGYGSLLNPESAASTFPDTPSQGHPPVLAFGAKRIFNYQIPWPDLRLDDGSPAGKWSAALNAEWTNHKGDWLNGRLIELSREALADFREREKGYDLMPVSCIWWESPLDAPFTAWVLCATKRPWKGVVYVDDNILPFPSYYELCRNGAQGVSDLFLQSYLATTLLADGSTTLAVWEADGRPEIL